MKRIIIIMAGLFIFEACNNAKNKAAIKPVTYRDLTIENLKGDIQTIEETPYKVDSTGKMGDMDSCCISVSAYDTNGNKIKRVFKDYKETLKREIVYTRHENGFWKSITEIKDGKARLVFDSQLDKEGKWIGEGEYDSAGKFKGYDIITANEYGQVLTWKGYDKDSILKGQGEIKYDRNLLVERTDKDSAGKIKRTMSARYNDRSEQTEVIKTIVVKDSPTTEVIKFTYGAHDDMGNWTQRTEWNDKGKVTKIIKRVYTYRRK
ncbi:MAG TPA: hypothetical protein VI461_16725 [Chitinophagaceae bacterium]|nr:hypothetical protein [Chitinophagaceae bacterium]